MRKIKPRTLSGFMELLPSEQVSFDTMMQKLRDSFSLFGFTPLDTPLMEASEILLAKGGGETEKQMYQLSKGDTDLALRYELTTSLAKYVSLYYNDLTFPFRRYEIGKVYRGERAQRGRFREFYQADIDIIGDGSLNILNEAEIPSVIYKALTSLGLSRFYIRINNRKVLGSFYEIIGAGDKATEIMRTVDKLDKVGSDKLSKMLSENLGLTDAQISEIISFVTYKGDPFEILDKYKGKNETFDKGTEELLTLKTLLSGFGVPESHYKIDLSLARGLDYYTGTVYETYLTDYPEVGSIGGGGRYDNLAEYFTDRKMPGVGISIGLNRLFYILQEQKLLSDDFYSSPADVLIIPMTDDLSPAVTLATSMREAGLKVQIYNEDKKFKVKVSYANKLDIPFVAFLGEDEIKGGVITVKDMTNGQQTTASSAMLTAGICDKIKELNKNPPVR
ncbi:MAG: histidine--tRNA ligase [Oscillospiraceae bacterium]|nr:histidine--tRNA ligase [Oscillospiraceae bacterium]MCL2278818.1 histidine--tRNA ligase [Oscillospiraceae bacterium]